VAAHARVSGMSASAAKYWILREERLFADSRHQREVVDHLAPIQRARTTVPTGQFSGGVSHLDQGGSSLKGVTIDDEDLWGMRSETKRRHDNG
jgi:hypothetical protein